MPAAVKVCRVCGKKYEACRTPNTSGAFRWRDVACSVECGAEHLRRVNESRGVHEAEPEVMSVETSVEEDVVLNEEIFKEDAKPSFETFRFFKN